MIAIIGAGVSGLATAFYLQKNNIPCQLFESSNRVGGCICTQTDGEYLMENGPNSLLCDDAVWEILEETGLKEKVVYPNDVSKSRFILKKGKYRKLSPPAVLFSGFFSLKSKWATVTEPFNKSVGEENETVANFFRRRFSEQIVQYAVNPFVSGIYAGDPEKLLIRFTFPALFKLEKQYGSVLKGFFKKKEKAGRKTSVSFEGGMETIVKTIGKHLNIRLNTPIDTLEKAENGYLINNEWQADKIIFTTPAHITAKIATSLVPNASVLNQLNYPPMCIIHSVFKEEENMFPLNGFGGLHPKVEGKFTAGSIWSSSLFEGRAPKDEIMLTTFVGGSLSADKTVLPDQEIMQNTTAELQALFNFKASPVKQNIFRWQKAIPQYDKNLISVESLIKEFESKQLYVNANWWGGVSVADCLRKGKQLAASLSN